MLGCLVSQHWSHPEPVSKSLRSAVSAPEPRPLGQYQLQLRRGPASDQGPDQGQGVLVEVCLQNQIMMITRHLDW